MSNIADIRKDYSMQSLSENDVDQNALVQFEKWWNQALESKIDEVNAMTLATADKSGIPSARIVLLKGFDKNGFVFFSNYQSNKANEMEENPNVSLVFFWKELERQIRIQGLVEKTEISVSDDYFNSRPDISKIGAWASPQSKVVASREILETNFQDFENQFKGANIPRPPHWGGYLVRPSMIEFWQGRPGRLHDRIRYRLLNDKWSYERLAP